MSKLLILTLLCVSAAPQPKPHPKPHVQHHQPPPLPPIHVSGPHIFHHPAHHVSVPNRKPLQPRREDDRHDRDRGRESRYRELEERRSLRHHHDWYKDWWTRMRPMVDARNDLRKLYRETTNLQEAEAILAEQVALDTILRDEGARYRRELMRHRRNKVQGQGTVVSQTAGPDDRTLLTLKDGTQTIPLSFETRLMPLSYQQYLKPGATVGYSGQMVIGGDPTLANPEPVLRFEEAALEMVER